MSSEKLTIHAVILAGGRGTRFWPRSRTRTPKQLLNIIGKETMLEQTVARLRPLISPDRIWSVTNAEQTVALKKQLPAASRKRVLTEPVGRNTAAAIALAAFDIRHATKGDALMAVLPADHFIAQPEEYRSIVAAALNVAREPGRMVVLGIPPTRPETGFGYVERMGEALDPSGFPVFAVRRFTEKPALQVAQEYVASGNYHWNAGMFFWRVSTFLDPGGAPAAVNYQLKQSLLAVGSGGAFGVGFGEGRQQAGFLPYPYSDFIASNIGEEWGFVGLTAITLAFALYALLGFRIARSARSPFLQLLAVGLTFVTVLTAYLHIGVVIGLLPTTGLTLPFVSYGRSNLVLTMLFTGILVNIGSSKERVLGSGATDPFATSPAR